MSVESESDNKPEFSRGITISSNNEDLFSRVSTSRKAFESLRFMGILLARTCIKWRMNTERQRQKEASKGEHLTPNYLDKEYSIKYIMVKR